MTASLAVIAHNFRSAHNIGSLFRTCDGLGVEIIYLTGYTPFPKMNNDSRLPHLAEKINARIVKTSLGAEKSLHWEYRQTAEEAIDELRRRDFYIAALEQSPGSVSLPDFKPPRKTAILLGSEVDGISPGLLSISDATVEIPMRGSKESFNVIQAAAMALYHCIYCIEP